MSPREKQRPGGLKSLGAPAPVRIITGVRGEPRAVNGLAVESVAEDWVVEDRWWTGRPLRRRYFELVLVDGRNTVVFHDLRGGGWFLQRA